MAPPYGIYGSGILDTVQASTELSPPSLDFVMALDLKKSWDIGYFPFIARPLNTLYKSKKNRLGFIEKISN